MNETKPPAARPFREPDALDREVLDDWSWVLQERSNGRFDEYAGKHVAVVNRNVLGSSSDPDLLEQDVAQKHHVEPRRIVIFYVDAW